MLRGKPFKVVSSRNVYIPTNSLSSNAQKWHKSTRKSEFADEKRKIAELDANLRKIRLKQSELKSKLQQARDKELQSHLAKKEGAKLLEHADPVEIETLDAQLRLPPSHLHLGTGKNVTHGLKNSLSESIIDSLPPSICQLLPDIKNSPQAVQLFENPSLRWPLILARLPVMTQSIPAKDIELFVSQIPLKIRAEQVGVLEHLVPDRLRTQYIRDLFMGCYAELGQTSKIEELISQSSHPTVHSFGNLAKSLFRNQSSPESVLLVLKRMKEIDLKPSLPIMSVAIQSMIQHNRHDEAQMLFDNMKYWSVNTQPDIKLFNSMILSAAKQHNVNRCLDLFTEMQTRRPYPLKPNEETYNYMIYACSKDPNTHLKAWEFFMEATNYGFNPKRESFRALLYLCGKAGEILLARALIRNLSAKSIHLIDDFTLNCLMIAYRYWKPTGSAIMASSRGPQIRANLMMEDGGSVSSIPFLPVPKLNRQLILAESNAIIEYFAANYPEKLRVTNKASMSTSPILHNYLRVAIDLGDDIDEFRRRFNRFTKFDSGQKILDDEYTTPSDNHNSPQRSTITKSLLFADLSSQNSKFIIIRDHHLYRLAIHAAIKFKNLEFGRQVWTERGNWRHGPQFQSLPPNKRNRYDFQFARDLIELLAACGRIDESILLAKSAQNLGQWTRKHLSALISQCEALEDKHSLGEISKLVRKS